MRIPLAFGCIVLSVLGAVACSNGHAAGPAAPAAHAAPTGHAAPDRALATSPARPPAGCTGPARRAWAEEIGATGKVRWQLRLATDPTMSGPSLQPVVIGGTVFFSEENVLYAQRLSDGHQLWRKAFPPAVTGADTFDSSLVYGLWQWHGSVIVLVGAVASTTRLFSLNPATGAVRWMSPIRGGLTGNQALTGDGGLAMIRGYASLLVVNLANGHARWSRTTAHAPIVAVDGVVMVPQGVYPAQRYGTVTGYDARTGAVLWTRRDMPAQPLLQVVGGHVVVYGRTSPVLELSPVTGRTLWQVPTGGPVYMLSAGAGPGGIAVSTYAPSRLYLIDPVAGRVKWYVEMLVNPATLLVTQTDVTFVGAVPGHSAPAGGELVDLRASDGSVRWHTALPDATFGQDPVLSFGADVVVSVGWGAPGHPARLVAYRKTTGARTWTTTIPTLVQVPIAIAGADLLVQPTDPIVACPAVGAVTAVGAATNSRAAASN
jgi:outer membrane protein assembly factor BamB